MSIPAIEDIYPLTPNQKTLLFHCVRETSYDPGFIPLTHSVFGSIDLERLQKALDLLVRRHSALRTSIEWEDIDEPVQIVHRTVSMPPRVVDLSHLSGEDLDNAIATVSADSKNKGLRVDTAPLLKLTILALGADRFEFLWGLHHLVVDGWSSAIMVGDLFRIYDAIGRTSQPYLPGCEQFGAYVKWVKSAHEQEAHQFWSTHLSGFNRPTSSPVEHRSRGAGDTAATRVSVYLREDQVARLKASRVRFQVTDGTLLTAAWALVLADSNRTDDVTMGIADSGRAIDLPHVEEIVGPLATTVPFRTRVVENRPVQDWLPEVQKELQRVVRYGYLPSSRILEASGLHPGRRVYDTVLMVENYPQPDVGTAPYLRVENFRSSVATVFPLAIVYRPDGQCLEVFFDTAKMSNQDASWVADLLRSRLDLLASCSRDAMVSELVRQPMEGRPEQRIALPGGRTRVEARSAVERLLAQLWGEVLDVQDIGIEDNFFDLGGHSLSAVHIAAEIEKAFRRRIGAVAIAKQPTIRELARFLEADDNAQSGFEVVVTLNEGSGNVPPVFAIPPPGGDAIVYAEVARYVSPERPMIAFQAAGLDGETDVLQSFEAMAATYIEHMRQTRAQGPYHLMTMCEGGPVAFEIACQLRSSGQEVGALTIVDPSWIFPERGHDFRLERSLTRKASRIARSLVKGDFARLFGAVGLRKKRREARERERVRIDEYDPVHKRLVDAHRIAAKNYAPSRYDGKIFFILSEDWQKKPDLESRLARWRFLSLTGIEVKNITGSHFSASQGRAASVLASAVDDFVLKAEFERGTAG